ncbi:MAG: hypothetical protein WBL23_11070 [Salinisphaera sp.]|uniref:hypothetical protein n=1 Tax=Salinisphaera sp. TaxID=1914330 RepID=UPI003C79DA12
MIAIARRSLVCATAIVLCTFIVAGCASHPARQPTDQGGNHYAPAESIIVPDGDSTLVAGLRRALAERGWHLIGYSGDMTSGHADYAAMARRAKYRLTLMGTPVGQCHNGDPSFLYRIAIIQNKDGDVPVAISGADCLTPILGEFSTDLDQKQLAPIPRTSTPARTAQ